MKRLTLNSADMLYDAWIIRARIYMLNSLATSHVLCKHGNGKQARAT